jgi:hypothetical protein
VLNLEGDLHAEHGALLDCERLVLERGNSGLVLQVDDDVWPAIDLEAEGEDDALARVAGVGDVLASSQAERLFPLAEGLIVLVCGEVI